MGRGASRLGRGWLRAVVLVSFLAGVASPLRGARDIAWLSGLLDSSSPIERAKALSLIRDEQIVEAVPTLSKIALNPSRSLEVRREAIDALLTVEHDVAFSAAADAGRSMLERRGRTAWDLPPDLDAQPDFAPVLEEVRRQVAGRAETYLISRLSTSRFMQDSVPFEPYLGAASPPLAKAAALLALERSAVPSQDVAARLYVLTRDPLPVVRALAYRCACVKVSAADVGSFVGEGLKDQSPFVVRSVLASVASVGPLGLESTLTSYEQGVADSALKQLAGVALDSVKSSWRWDLVRTLGWCLQVLAVLALLGAAPSGLRWWQRRGYRRALALWAAADYAQAATAFREVARGVEELKPVSLVYLLRALVRVNNLREATEVFDQIDPKRLAPDLLYDLAVDLDGKGLKTSAASLYRQIIDKAPGHRDVQSRFDMIDAKFGGGGKAPAASALVSSSASIVDLLRKALPESYTDLKLIGKGGMGSVFSAMDGRTKEMVAIKVLAPELAHREEVRTRFYRESVAIANLSHPNICKIKDIKKAELPFIIMEFIDGMSIKELLLRKKQPLKLREFFALALPVADALGYAHGMNIVHRDIKPENILVTKKVVPKIVDFGLVKFDEGSSDLTSTGAIMGTPLYMSPEQLAGVGSRIDARTDVFALGLTMYELLSIQYAFESKETYRRVLQEPIPLRSRNTAVPAQLEAIILSCLRREPEERPSNGAELKGLLEAVRGLCSAVQPPAASQPAPPVVN